MKHSFLRRLGALTLAVAMALSLMAAPAWAYDGPTTGLTVSKDGQDVAPTAGGVVINMKVGDPAVTLAVRPTDVAGDTSGLTYAWGNDGTLDDIIKVEENPADTSSIKVTALKAGESELTVMTAAGTGDGLGAIITIKVTGASVTPTDPPVTPTPTPTEPPITVTGITVDPATYELKINNTVTLTVVPAPADAHMGEVTWSSSDTSVAAVEPGSTNGTAVVTGKKEGTARITASTKGKNGETLTRDCTVTVPREEVYATGGFYFSPNSIRIDKLAGDSEEVRVMVTPTTCNQVVEWSVADPNVVKVEAITGVANPYAQRVRLRVAGPGTTQVTARIKESETQYRDAILTVTVSGLKITNPPGSMTEFDTYQLQYDAFGLAETTAGTVVWTSSDPATVAVSAKGGTLVALKPGTVTITLQKGSYTDTCQVTVGEDMDSIIEAPGSYNAGKPLVMSALKGQLNGISILKENSTLSYISNVSVPTEQGTLYYNYNSEANTGDGVGIGDRFYYNTAPAGRATLEQLTFVPRQGFSGTAEITFNGVAQNNNNFSGTIRVQVNGSGDGSGIYYGAVAGQPTTFLVDDFNAYCNAVTGRDLNYVVFNLPSTTMGTLYYNYTSPSSYGTRVSASTQYSRTGNTNLGRVSFVPSTSYLGDVSITFRGVNTAGMSFNGTVLITVGSSSMGLNPADVSFSAQDGKQVTLRPTEFNNACRSTIGETLSYVRFSLPAASEGVLYYNYNNGGARVDATTRYYYSGTPGIGDVTFVAAANAGGQVAIPYTGYSSSGATYTGTIYINLQGDNQTTIRYSVNKNGLVALNVNDFNNVCLRQTGYSMDYVRFAAPTSSASGNPPNLLYYNYRSNITRNTRVTSSMSFYRAYDSRNPGHNLLGNVTFLAGSTARTVSIPYTVYANTATTAGTRSFSGTLEILVGAPTPADVTLTGRTSSAVWLPSSSIRSACSAVMNNDLSYIEITSVPDEKVGRVYSVYSGIRTGTEVTAGTRYYRAGSPSMDQLSFVPYGGFNGTAVITYIGYSSNGLEQVSGQIKITIANSTTSRYFNDMRNHGWAADAVDFLYENNISNGVGGGRYSPSGTLTRGDFTLMLVRTFGFTSTKTYRFNDVPATSYYATAISTAKALGITVGESGSSFYPERAISRQDAIVMLYNALKASGNTLTNGLTADLSIFSDRGSISSYALNAVGTLVQMGVVKGDGNGRLRPTSSLSRAETAILLQYVLTL